jgi:hypothetical protein
LRLRALFFVAASLGMCAPAWGHVVMTDGTIGVTMHVDPDDAPISGKPSRFYFWFKDTTGHLDPAQCQGAFTVALGDTMVSNQALFAQVSLGLISVHDVTFPHSGVYTVRVNGSPRGRMSFQPFLIEFSVRVTAGGTENQSGGSRPSSWFTDHSFLLGLGVLLGALILWWGFRPARSGKKK